MKFLRRRHASALPHAVSDLARAIDTWKPGELALRSREVEAAEKTTRSQTLIQLAQVLAVVVALASTLVALYTAQQNSEASKAAAETSVQQANEAQLSSAISTLDAGKLFARTTKMLLIQRYIRAIMSQPLSTPEAKQGAYSDYTMAFNTFSLYIRTHSPRPGPKFGPGYGIPSETPLDLIYAADGLSQLTSMGLKVKALQVRGAFFADISGAELYGMNLPELDVSGFTAFYLRRVDLRTANLVNARFLGADLSGAYLQCANLSGADLRGANLAGADLRGASVQGANFTGALTTGAKLEDMFGAAKGLPRNLVRARSYNPTKCAKNRSFWDNVPSHS